MQISAQMHANTHELYAYMHIKRVIIRRVERQQLRVEESVMRREERARES